MAGKTRTANPLRHDGLLGKAAHIVLALAISLTAIARPTTAQALTQTDRDAYSLSETEWGYYQEFEEKFARVANGETTSTTFDIDIPRMLGQSEWSAADNDGMEPVIVMDVMDGLGEVPHISASFDGQIARRVDDQLNRALAVIKWENPAVSDWYRENAGSEVEIRWNTENRDGNWFVSIESATISCPVEPSYRGESYYEVNPDAISQMRECLARAQDIASWHSGEPALQMLTSYCDEIYARTSYDHGASPASSLTYSMPWSLVSVFDENPNTRSVCVAYSMALKLLIKLSGRDDVLCHIVDGYCATSTVGGNHMWCVIGMPDGKNYLADVTNNSPGTINAGGLLVVPAYGSVDGGYQTHKINYSYGSLPFNVYQTNSLWISDTTYTPPPPPQEYIAEPAEEPIEGSIEEAVTLGKAEEQPAQEDPPESNPQQTEVKREWTIPLVENKCLITVLPPDSDQMRAQRELTARSAEIIDGWITAIAATFIVCVVASVVMIFVYTGRRR